MASYKSQQLTLVDGQGAERIENGDVFGRQRSTYFEFNTTDEGLGTVAITETVELARIPAGARITGIFLANEDLGTTVTLDIGLKGTDGGAGYDKAGTVNDDDFFTASAIDLTSAVAIPTNVIDNYAASSYLTDKAVTIEGTFAAATTVTADTNFKGYVQYVVD